MHEHIVICKTPGCENASIPIALTVDESDPEIPHPYMAACGVCGQEIADVSPPMDHGEE